MAKTVREMEYDGFKAFAEELKDESFSPVQIPKIYAENNRIVDHGSAEAQVFQKEMERILLRLYPHYDLQANPIIFLIEDSKQKNAYILNLKSSAIVDTLAILKDFKSEDELAYVLGHEMGHKLTAEELGEGANSLTEEIVGCDIRSLTVLHKAGYDVREALNFHSRLEEWSESSLADILDVHGLPEYRTEAVEKAISALDNIIGGLKYKPTPISAAMSGVIQNAKHESYLDSIINTASYQVADNVGRLNLLAEQIANVPQSFYQRARDFGAHIWMMDLDLNDPKIKEALENVLVGITKNPTTTTCSLGHIVPKLFGKGKPASPVGELKELENQLSEFLKSSTPQQAEEAALAILHIVSSYKDNLEVFKKFAWPTFKIPSEKKLGAILESGESFIAPWNKQVIFAQKSNSQPIAEVLLHMGANDERVLELLPKERLESLYYSIESNTILFPISSPDTAYTKLSYDDIGEAIEYVVYPITFSSLAENILKRELDRVDEKSELTFTDISPLEFYEGFENLFQQNLAVLTLPDEKTYYELKGDNLRTDKTRNYLKNINILLSKFDELLVLDKEKYTPFVKNFFLDNAPEYFHKICPNFVDLEGFMKYVASNKHGIFSLEEQFAVFKRDMVGSESIGLELRFWRDLLGYEAPKSYKELCAVIKKIEACHEVSSAEAFRGHGLSYPDTGIVAELNYFLINKESKLYNPLQVMHDHGEYLDRALTKTSGNLSESSNELRMEFQELIVKTRALPKSPETLIRIYHVFQDMNLYPSLEYKVNFVDALSKALERISTPEQKVRLSEFLLNGGKYILDVDLRQQAVKLWAEANKEIFGTDNGTEEYYAAHNQNFVDLVDRVKAQSSFNQRYEMFSELANTLETQKPWSLFLKDSLIEYSRGNNQRIGTRMSVIQGILHVAKESKEGRDETIRFLTGKLNHESESRYEEFLLMYSERLSKSVEELENLDDLLDTNPDFLKITTRQFYENFWGTSVVARIAMMDSLLIDAQAKNQDRLSGDDKNYQEAFKTVTDLLFPDTQKYASHSKTIIAAYARVIPDYQRSLLLSALMVAGNKTSGQEKEASIGEKLAMILEVKGPAERKTGQRIPNHRSTPEDIKRDMQRLKSMADVPARWDLIERYEEVVPQEYRDENISRVGKLMGAASYAYTVRLERQDGSVSVMSLQRPNAAAQATEGFRLLRGLVQELRQETNEFEAIAENLQDMISHAEQKIKIETDPNIGAQQLEIAQQRYNGLSVKVGERVLNFKTASWYAYGAEFRDQEEIPGVHFNDLPNASPEEQKNLKEIALGHTAVEVLNKLSGLPYDDDRHDAQLRISGDNIGLFDHGAMNIKPFSKEDKAQLTKIIINGIAAVKSGKSIDAVVTQSIDDSRDENGNVPECLIQLQTALWAESKFLEKVQPEDFIGIVAAAYKSGEIDGVVLQTAIGMFLQGKVEGISLASLSPSESNISFVRTKERPSPKPVKCDTTVLEKSPEISFVKRTGDFDPDKYRDGNRTKNPDSLCSLVR